MIVIAIAERTLWDREHRRQWRWQIRAPASGSAIQAGLLYLVAGAHSKMSRGVDFAYPRTLRDAFLVATLSPTNRKRSQPAVRTF
jgi:hypothetical protein